VSGDRSLRERVLASRRVLVIRRKALGDALVTLPAVLRLASALPAAAIDLVVDRPFAPLLAAMAGGLHVVTWPPPAGRPGGWVRALRAAHYDLVIDYLGIPRTALWTALTGAPLRVGYDLPHRRWAYNVRVPRNLERGVTVAAFAGEAFLDPLRVLGLDPLPWRAGEAGAPAVAAASLGREYREWADTWFGQAGPHAALIFSATWPAKAWPAAHAARLYAGLAGAGVVPVFVTGPGDADLARDLLRVMPAAAFAPPTTLPELADLLARCQVCVATDNGARHLAACLGTVTVTLFGPTDPRGWNPADPRHVAAVHPVSCAPCDLTVCPVAGHPCLDDLTPDDVAAVVQRLLHVGPGGS
jgi:ADP-heptose:LPS heptosyltransferase